MSKRRATDDEVMAFMRAVFPAAPDLALAAFDEAHVLKTATARIAALEAGLREACDELDGFIAFAEDVDAAPYPARREVEKRLRQLAEEGKV